MLIFDEDYVKEIHTIMSRWLFQIICWCNDLANICKTNQISLYCNPLQLIIDFLCYDESLVYTEVCEHLYPEFYKYENNLFNMLEIDIQKKVMTIIYNLICNNRENISFILDNELLEEISSEFDKEFTLNFKENK